MLQSARYSIWELAAERTREIILPYQMLKLWNIDEIITNPTYTYCLELKNVSSSIATLYIADNFSDA